MGRKMSYWMLLPAAASLAGTLMSKPKEKDYLYDTKYMDKYINNLKGQSLDSQIYHMAMQPALRQIGAQTGRGQREVDKYTARNKPGGGVEAQMRLGLNQQALDSLEQAGQRAYAAQYGENRRLSELIGQVEMQKGAIESQGKMEYGRAKTAWNREVVSGGLGLAAGIGAEYATQTKALNDTLEKAKALDLVDDTVTAKEFKQIAANAGFKNAGEYVNQLGRTRGIDQAVSYDPKLGNMNHEEQIGILQEAAKSGKISPENAVTGIAQHREAMRLEQQFKAGAALDPYEDLTEEDIYKAVEEGLDPKIADEKLKIVRDIQKNREYVNTFANLMVDLDTSRKTLPEDFEGRVNKIISSDLPPKLMMEELTKESTHSSGMLTSWQNKLFKDFANPKTSPKSLIDGLTKNNTLDEAKLAYTLYNAKYQAQMPDGADRITYAKIGKGVADMKMVHNALSKRQTALFRDPKMEYLIKATNVNSYGELTEVGRNLDTILAYIEDLKTTADMPKTLQVYSQVYGSSNLTPEKIQTFTTLGDDEKVKFIQNLWADDMKKGIRDALAGANFPGVLDPARIITYDTRQDTTATGNDIFNWDQFLVK